MTARLASLLSLVLLTASCSSSPAPSASSAAPPPALEPAIAQEEPPAPRPALRPQALMAEPYRSLKVLPPLLHGWMNEANARHLERLIGQTQPKVIIELGTWLGKSAMFMAEKAGTDTVIYCIDHWYPQEVDNIPELEKLLPTLYQQFLSNVVHKELTQQIVPCRMWTAEAARALDVKADLVYVDASHEEPDVYHDVSEFYKKLNSGGVICGDDYDWNSVKAGVGKAAKELGFKVQNDEGFWYVERE